MLDDLSIGLSIKFIVALGRFAAVSLKEGQFFRKTLPYLRSTVHFPGMKRFSCQSERGKAAGLWQWRSQQSHEF
jgi:hypothetical protein